MKEIMVPVSPGELLDKLTILDIKSRRIADPVKRDNVARERRLLRDVARTSLPETPELASLHARLARVNEALWEVEDDLRDAEARSRFDESFIALARSVYRLNDERAALKREINMTLGSRLIEEKSYDGS